MGVGQESYSFILAIATNKVSHMRRISNYGALEVLIENIQTCAAGHRTFIFAFLHQVLILIRKRSWQVFSGKKPSLELVGGEAGVLDSDDQPG